jgi:hypothetical protein
MNRSCLRFFQLGLPFFLLITFSNRTWGAELTVQIRSPKDGSPVTQEQAYVLIGGKAAVETGGSGSVDIFLVLDVSGSTAQYSGAEFTEFSQLPNVYINPSTLGGHGLPCAGPNRPGPLNLRNSILAAEIVASRRLLSKLNPETTRVGVITFGEEVWVRQRLTRYFEEVLDALDLIYKRGPYGGTNMVDAIDVAADELLGQRQKRKIFRLDQSAIVLYGWFSDSTDGRLLIGRRRLGHQCRPAGWQIRNQRSRVCSRGRGFVLSTRCYGHC